MDSAGVLARIERRIRPHLRDRRALEYARSLRRTLERRGLGTVSVTAAGFKVVGGLSDRRLLQRLAKDKVEPYTLSLWQAAIDTGMQVVDVGAHIGVFTMHAARLVGDGGRVWAIEPNPTSRRLLERNLKLNKLGNVTVVSAAASDATGTATLHVVAGDRSQSSLVHRGAAVDAHVEVPTRCLDDLLAPEVRVDVVKIDTEGSEPAILTGMRRILASAQMLVVESNDTCLARAGFSRHDLYTALRSAGFDVFAIDERRRRLDRGSEPCAGRRVFNVLATRPGSGAAQRLGVG